MADNENGAIARNEGIGQTEAVDERTSTGNDSDSAKNEDFRSPQSVDPIDWKGVERWVSMQGHSLTIPDTPRQFSGGLANSNYLVNLDGIAHVLRCPPPGPLPIGANDMAREHRILSGLAHNFPLAPRAPLYCPDAKVIGRPFLLIEYRDGLVVRDELPPVLDGQPALCERLAVDMIDVLAHLHSLDPRDVGLENLGKPEGMVARQAKNWTRRALEAFDGQLPVQLEAAARWLERPAPTPQRTSVLHCDFKLNNIILARQSLKPIAVLDWDMGTLGDPLFDLATLLSYWADPDDHPGMLALRQMPSTCEGFPSRAQIIAIYHQKSGIPVDDFGYYRVLALFKLCVVFQQLSIRHLRGNRKDPHAATFESLVTGLIDFTAFTLSTEKH